MFVRNDMLRILRTAAFAALACLAAPISFSAQDQDENEETAPSDELEKINEWRDDVDIHMVAIEALVIEVNEDRTRDLGLHYGYEQDGDGADFRFGRPRGLGLVPTLNANDLGETSVDFIPKLPGLGIDLAGIQIGAGNFSVKLRALVDQGEARISTRPVVLTMHNKSAVIKVGSQVPYQDLKVKGNREVPAVAEGQVGVILEILPRIVDLKEQIVDLDIQKVEVSSVSNFITTQNIDRPVFNTAETRTRIYMRSGETHKLSSLKARRSRNVRKGVPLLMHIPVLGNLFSSREEVFEGVDILFFVTPHIVPPGQNILLPHDFAHGVDLVSHGVEPPE